MIARRSVLRAAAFAPVVAVAAQALGQASAGALPAAVNPSADLGILVDYAGGVPDAAAIAAAGYRGAIRYVSDRRPGAAWMIGKPMLATEAAALESAGLQVVSCYQFGRSDTADWLGGYTSGRTHAARGLALHAAAGGPASRPIYASIDDNPTRRQFDDQIAPYLQGWESVLGHAQTGVYGNANVIEWASNAGLGSWFWMHDWGTPDGYVHPKAHLHQFEINSAKVGGVPVDRNRILQADYGQWFRGAGVSL